MTVRPGDVANPPLYLAFDRILVVFRTAETMAQCPTIFSLSLVPGKTILFIIFHRSVYLLGRRRERVLPGDTVYRVSI